MLHSNKTLHAVTPHKSRNEKHNSHGDDKGSPGRSVHAVPVPGD